MPPLPKHSPKFSNHYRKNLEPSELKSFMELKNILDLGNIHTVFQPVVSLTDASIIGYEALSRGPANSPLERPDALFAAAARHNLVWELEYLCRAAALEKAKDIIPRQMLFLNVDPSIINDPRFQKGQTQDMLRRFQANAGNVIFEITEKTAIQDYKSFCRILDNYTSQGYKIAIDDTGSGYSGLRTLAATRPNFIKVDMDLVRDIDKDNLKQSMIKALLDFSLSTNIKLIAEGIETKEELTTLINIGVPLGQGFFLQRPHPDFVELSPALTDLILEINRMRKRELFYTPITMPVGEIAQQEDSFPSSALGYTVIDYFNNKPATHGVAIVDNGQPVGLLMKGRFLANLATQYGLAIYMNRPIRSLMDRNPLIVDYSTPIEIVSKAALARKDDNVYDYILVTKDGKYFGIITVKRLLEKTTQLELNRAKHANPLTGLPGNIMIEEELARLLHECPDYAVLYFDLDNFKAYNDVYGFERGDKFLCFTAALIQEQLRSVSDTKTFLGHIGGDDFVALLYSSDVAALCERIIESFDAQAVTFFTPEDRARGFIVAKNRRGELEEFPLVSLSVAVITSRGNQFNNVLEMSEAASHVKKKCKLIWKSCYCIE